MIQFFAFSLIVASSPGLDMNPSSTSNAAHFVFLTNPNFPCLFVISEFTCRDLSPVTLVNSARNCFHSADVNTLPSQYHTLAPFAVAVALSKWNSKANGSGTFEHLMLIHEMRSWRLSHSGTFMTVHPGTHCFTISSMIFFTTSNSFVQFPFAQ